MPNLSATTFRLVLSVCVMSPLEVVKGSNFMITMPTLRHGNEGPKNKSQRERASDHWSVSEIERSLLMAADIPSFLEHPTATSMPAPMPRQSCVQQPGLAFHLGEPPPLLNITGGVGTVNRPFHQQPARCRECNVCGSRIAAKQNTYISFCGPPSSDRLCPS